MQVRTTRSECPRAAKPVVRTRPAATAPMSRPVATPFSTTPDTMQHGLHREASAAGSNLGEDQV